MEGRLLADMLAGSQLSVWEVLKVGTALLERRHPTCELYLFWHIADKMPALLNSLLLIGLFNLSEYGDQEKHRKRQQLG